MDLLRTRLRRRAGTALPLSALLCAAACVGTVSGQAEDEAAIEIGEGLDAAPERPAP